MEKYSNYIMLIFIQPGRVEGGADLAISKTTKFRFEDISNNYSDEYQIW